MAMPERPDEQVAEEILALLRDDQPDAPPDLGDRTLQKVRAEVTLRDLIDLTTFVFVLRFCAPVIEMIAAMFGVELTDNDRRNHDE